MGKDQNWENATLLVLFSKLLDKIPDRKQFKRERIYLNLQLNEITVITGKAQWQEQEDDGHVASLIKKQRMVNVFTCSPFSWLFSLEPYPIEWW